MFFARSVTLASVRVDPPDLAPHAFLGRDHGLGVNERRRRRYMWNALDFLLKGFLVLHPIAGELQDDDMRHGGEDLVAEIPLETGHHGKGDDGCGDADDHAGNGNERIERNGAVALFGF
jgi:hypothetical protein